MLSDLMQLTVPTWVQQITENVQNYLSQPWPHARMYFSESGILFQSNKLSDGESLVTIAYHFK